MSSWRMVKIRKKSWLISNPDLLENFDLISIGHIFLTHKDIVNLLKISGSQFSLLHAQYIVFADEILVVFRTGMKKYIYLGPNLLVFFNKFADYGPMIALMNILGDLVNTNQLSDITILEVFRLSARILPDV